MKESFWKKQLKQVYILFAVMLCIFAAAAVAESTWSGGAADQTSAAPGYGQTAYAVGLYQSR